MIAQRQIPVQKANLKQKLKAVYYLHTAAFTTLTPILWDSLSVCEMLHKTYTVDDHNNHRQKHNDDHSINIIIIFVPSRNNNSFKRHTFQNKKKHRSNDMVVCEKNGGREWVGDFYCRN